MKFDKVQTGEKIETLTGAKRSDSTGKGRFDLLPPFAMRRWAAHFENGILTGGYEERNWERGCQFKRFIDSARRHINDFMADRIANAVPEEDHIIAAIWNLMALVETQERVDLGILPAELDDLPNPPKYKGRKKEDDS